MNRESDNLQALGKATKYRDDYAPEVLESFENKHPGNDYWVRFNCPEFTSLCPITGQPDFAEIRINYLPDHKMVESKSLKLYLFSFRNHGDFHEDCVNIIMKDLIKLMDPKYIEVTGIFTPRGGISIYPYANYGRPGTKYEKWPSSAFFITTFTHNATPNNHPSSGVLFHNPLLRTKNMKQDTACFCLCFTPPRIYIWPTSISKPEK